ncbi:MAG: PIN domain-containing protein [Acidobacteriota bacterium]
MILLDTSGLLAWIDARQRGHRAVAKAMETVDGPYLLSPFVLAELDYLLATRVGAAAQYALMAEVESGAYRLESFDAADVGLALSVMRRFADLEIGLADASIVVLAARHGCSAILTLDERHFRVVSSFDGEPFRLLPADT